MNDRDLILAEVNQAFKKNGLKIHRLEKGVYGFKAVFREDRQAEFVGFIGVNDSGEVISSRDILVVPNDDEFLISFNIQDHVEHLCD